MRGALALDAFQAHALVGRRWVAEPRQEVRHDKRLVGATLIQILHPIARHGKELRPNLQQDRRNSRIEENRIKKQNRGE